MSMKLHELGITLERIVTRLNADLKEGGYNHADFYDYGKGIIFGIRQCLVRLRENLNKIDFRTNEAGSPRARLGVGLDCAIRKLTELHNNPEYEPENYLSEIEVSIEMLLAFEGLYQHVVGNDRP